MTEPSTYLAHAGTTLDEARSWLNEQAKTSGGALCPCCSEKQKARGCKPTPAQAAMLVIMYNNYQLGQTVDADAVATAAGIGGLSATGLERMALWDLLEVTDTKGHYTLCEGGYFFVHKDFPITPRAWVLGGRVVARDGKPTKLVKILGDKFDLNELYAVRF